MLHTSDDDVVESFVFRRHAIQLSLKPVVPPSAPDPRSQKHSTKPWSRLVVKRPACPSWTGGQAPTSGSERKTPQSPMRRPLHILSFRVVVCSVIFCRQGKNTKAYRWDSICRGSAWYCTYCMLRTTSYVYPPASM